MNIIEIQSKSNNKWEPFNGEEVTELLKSKGFTNSDNILNETGERILEETTHILEICGNPESPVFNETGLVIGYVQSGKTLSFTALTALARDNHFQIVIVLAGTTVPLVSQSTERLKRDLRLESRHDRKWTLLQNPSKSEDRNTIETALAQWADPTYDKDDCRTILITVMKHGSHIRNLSNLFYGLNLQGVPTLIIDDESDQATPNTRAKQAARQGRSFDDLTSTIYSRITELRTVFPHQTFLQYTATPQANLFINIMDRLSPNYIRLLTPGVDYTGGIHFFIENPSLVEEIPLSEIPSSINQVNEPPESLLKALRIFFLGVVAGKILKDQHNRSMLVHPSRFQEDHSRLFSWVKNICAGWGRLLSGNDIDERNILISDFKNAYLNLQNTVKINLPSFVELTGQKLIHAITYTEIIEVNSKTGATPQIRWKDSYSFILVGGQSMDRGFTVEGLTVTYMPRNIGGGNVDTIQQRARFFGYKKSYLGYCRVFLDQETIEAYRSIIQHEEDVRNRLQEYDVNNKHLNEWDREVVLDEMLNLTRTNILYNNLVRDRFGEEWLRINAPHDTEALIKSNYSILIDFLSNKESTFQKDQGHSKRTVDQQHLTAKVFIKDCLENLLNKLKFTGENDFGPYSSLRGILKQHINQFPDDQCLIFLMSAQNLENWTRRVRRLDKKGEISQLFQGKNPKTGEIIYPGDSEIKYSNKLTIQIHLLNIRDTDFIDVPTLAIWVPEYIGKDIMRQPNNSTWN